MKDKIKPTEYKLVCFDTNGNRIPNSILIEQDEVTKQVTVKIEEPAFYALIDDTFSIIDYFNSMEAAEHWLESNSVGGKRAC
jgi:hypothetical protein